MFVKLTKRRCLVVGAGKPAEEKIPTLLRCAATVVVVAPAATRAIQGWASENKIIWEQRRFEARDLDGVFLIVVAIPVKTLNRTVFEQAQQRRILCDVVRDRSLCDFYYPAGVRCKSPFRRPATVAPWLSDCADNSKPSSVPKWESWLRWLGEARSSLYDDPLSPKRRRRTMLHRLASQKKQAEFFRRWGYPSSRDERH